MHWLPFIKRY